MFKLKLIHDCVRDTLIYLEENLQEFQTIDDIEIHSNLSSYSAEDIRYTCRKLDEAGFLKIENWLGGGIVVIDITYNGHKFLDNIRDSGVWKETKSKLSKLSSVSLQIIQQVAAQIISSKLRF